MSDFSKLKSYFELSSLGYISNSGLSNVKRKILGGFMPKNIQKSYDFGTLVDSMITQKNLVNTDLCYVEEEGNSGKIISFEDEEIAFAENMKIAYDSDKDVQLFFKNASFQHIIVKEKFSVTFDKTEYKIKACCKFDLLVKKVIGGDIKTTACNTQKAFVNSIFNLDYDRQGAWYMDLAGIDKFMFIGIGKKPDKRSSQHPIFKYSMNRKSEAYKSGKEKYQKLVFFNQLIN